jgi:hypothetical protein
VTWVQPGRSTVGLEEWEVANSGLTTAQRRATMVPNAMAVDPLAARYGGHLGAPRQPLAPPINSSQRHSKVQQLSVLVIAKAWVATDGWSLIVMTDPSD